MLRFAEKPGDKESIRSKRTFVGNIARGLCRWYVNVCCAGTPRPGFCSCRIVRFLRRTYNSAPPHAGFPRAFCVEHCRTAEPCPKITLWVGGCTHSAPSAILIYLSYLWSWTGSKVEGLRIRFAGFMRHAAEIYVLWEKRTVGPPKACGRAVLVRFPQKTYNSACRKTGPRGTGPAQASGKALTPGGFRAWPVEEEKEGSGMFSINSM